MSLRRGMIRLLRCLSKPLVDLATNSAGYYPKDDEADNDNQWRGIITRESYRCWSDCSYRSLDVSPDRIQTKILLINCIKQWNENGFPFINPTFQKDTMDFAASTENTTGQGYWFSPDSEKEDEIIIYIKTPSGIQGHESETQSPYKSQTVRMRFLNWLPRKAKRAKEKAEEARRQGHFQRAVQLEYRAARFEDMSRQLANTVKFQRFARELARERAQPEKNEARISHLKKVVFDLKKSRRTAPPSIKVVEKQVSLHIPFMAPNEELLNTTLKGLERKRRKAGVDRGLRHSMVISVRNGDDRYEEILIGRQELYEKRERLRQRTRVLMCTDCTEAQ